MAGVEGNDRPLTYHYKYSQSQLKPSNCCLLQSWCHQSTRVRFNKTKQSPVVISAVCTAQVKLIYHTGRLQVARRQSEILCHWRSARHLPDSACLRAMSGVDNVCGNGHQ